MWWGHDCYCTICRGILENDLSIGDSTEQAKSTRDKILPLRFRTRFCRSDRSVRSEWESLHSSEDPRWTIESSYDPEVIQGHGRTWLGEVMCVTYDPDLDKTSKYYFSTVGWLADGTWEIVTGHPEGLDDGCAVPLYNREYYYDEKNPTRKLGFPFHEHCAQVLARVVAGSSDIGALDPTVLYQLMDERSKDMIYAAGLDYGPIQEEAVDRETARGLLLKHGANDEPVKALGMHRTVTDLFSKLPFEVIDLVADSLPVPELIMLSQTSMVVREETCGSGLWRRKVHKEMSWALDVISELVGEEQAAGTEEDPVDWMKAYVLFENANADDAWGMKGDYLGLANRKRIWKVCEQVKQRYEARVASGQSHEHGDTVSDGA